MSLGAWGNHAAFLKNGYQLGPPCNALTDFSCPLRLYSCSQGLDAVALGRGLCRCHFWKLAGDGGCCRLGDPHSKKGLKTDLHEERRRSGTEFGLGQDACFWAALPCFFLHFLAKCFMTPWWLFFFSQCISAIINSQVHHDFYETLVILAHSDNKK